MSALTVSCSFTTSDHFWTLSLALTLSDLFVGVRWTQSTTFFRYNLITKDDAQNIFPVLEGDGVIVSPENKISDLEYAEIIPF